MNKHIAGFILFNLIVGSSAVVAALFYEVPKIETIRVFEELPVTYSGRSCWRSGRNFENGQVNAKIVQAVFDENTNQLDMDLYLERKNHSTDYAGVKLHFFVKNGSETRYLATEKVDLTPNFNLDDKATQSISQSYKWLNNLKSHENLYVVPQTTFDADNYKKIAPRFDELNAAPVMVAERN